LQRREPNIRLLIPTGTSNSLRIPSPEVTSLKQVAKNKLTATTEKPKTGIAIATLPSYKAWDLWMIRIRGEVRTTSGTARPNIRIRLNSVDKGKACHYESPWALHHLPSLPDWQAFDMSVPVSPGRLPGGAKSLIAEVNLDTPDWKSNIARSGSVEIKDFQLEIMKLPQNPLSNGKLY
jgi:hypothetical protein